MYLTILSVFVVIDCITKIKRPVMVFHFIFIIIHKIKKKDTKLLLNKGVEISLESFQNHTRNIEVK